MRVSDLSGGELRDLLKSARFDLFLGPYTARLSSELDGIAESISLLYPDFPCGKGKGFADFHVRLAPVRRLRSKWAAEVSFLFDGAEPFLPLPRNQAGPFLEWGLNWCIATHVFDVLTVHAATVEKNGRALVLPGAPGSGKSTLCAGLVTRGWRLLSDEFALLTLDGQMALPAPRPISLKNASIEIIRERLPGAAMSKPTPDTRKGVIAHVRPPASSVRRMSEPALPAGFVFPTFMHAAGCSLTPKGRAQSFMAVAKNSFNYVSLGERAFEGLAAAVRNAACADLLFSDLDAALDALERFIDDSPPSSRAL